MTDPAPAGSVTFVNTMRFYRHSRTYRIWGSVLWGALLLFWIPAFWLHHSRHPWQPLIWIVLAATQLGSLLTFWDITRTSLIATAFGFKRSFRLAAIDYVGPPAPHRGMLSKTVQIDCQGRPSLFVTVNHKQDFTETLRSAVATQLHEPPTTGPLGLSV